MSLFSNLFGPSIDVLTVAIRARMGELPRGKHLLVCCASGLRSYVACRILSQHGFACANIAGGYDFHAQVERGRAVPHTNVGGCGLPV